MKHTIVFLVICSIVYGCSQNGTDNSTSDATSNQTSLTKDDYDPNRGIGKFDHVDVNGLDMSLASEGKLIADLKCASCHKYTEERLVGPGWKGVSKKHRPEWLMNFITNPDPMIDVDPQLQAQLEICLVRMPNQNLSDEDARAILEFMRQNDGAE